MANRIFLIKACILFCMVAAGCASTENHKKMGFSEAKQLASTQDVPDDLKPYYQRLYLEGEANATLNRMRLASAAMEQGEWRCAEQVLDTVIPEIEALGPADARSREALSHFKSEDIKKFKGEPYERSMAYFLRALLYIRNRDWSNARACLKSVQIQDAAKNKADFKGKWVSADWLQGWCAWNLGETSEAEECWNRVASQTKEGFSLPRPSSNHNAICVAFLGVGPIKIPKGKYGEHLNYQRASGEVAQVKIKWNENFQVIPAAEDLYAQAVSRGLRRMDLVNENKADTRAGMEMAGDVLIYGGMGTTIGGAVAEDPEVAAMGLGATATGMATKGVASAIRTKADTRTWDLLPATIHVFPVELPSADHVLEFQFLDSQGAIVSEQKIEISASQKPSLIFLTAK